MSICIMDMDLTNLDSILSILHLEVIFVPCTICMQTNNVDDISCIIYLATTYAFEYAYKVSHIWIF